MDPRHIEKFIVLVYSNFTKVQDLLNRTVVIREYKNLLKILDDLSIRDATRNDVGIYECRATNPAGIKADYAHVNLAGKFKISLKYSLKI